jgi:hypothetical protein
VKPLLLLVFSVLLIGNAAFGQSELKGRIIASDTRKPVALANVYLSNTAVGTVTNENGEFTIPSFPVGRFDLIVSFIGYETYRVSVQSGKLPVFLEIFLNPKINELKEVVVEPYEKDGWSQWGKFFLEHFVGTSAYAHNCKLVNKNAVKFRFSKKNNTLKAFSDETLVIENKALGYRVKYDLIQFEFDFSKRMFFYQGYPFFEELNPEAKANQKRRWENNRADAYQGSMMHFMRSLYRNRLSEDGFEVRAMTKISEQERQRVSNIYRSTMQKNFFNGGVGLSMGGGKTTSFTTSASDSMDYYRKVIQNPESFTVPGTELLPADSIAFRIDSTTAGLYFENHLQVAFPGKRMPAEYQQIMLRDRSLQPLIVTSEITITNGKAVAVFANGSYFEGTYLVTQGYWALNEKIGNMVPFGYWPEKKKSN